MKSKKLRIAVPLVLLGIVAAGFIFGWGLGTPSAFGWADISLICPLGALTTMIASKTVIPKAVVSLAVVAVLLVLLGRAFCGWLCPVPVVSRLRGLFTKKEAGDDRKGAGVLAPEDNPLVSKRADEAGLGGGCASCSHSCGGSTSQRTKIDSRHVILGGSLLSAAVFGFPVFCLICPIGLTVATILLVTRLFAFGDVSWAVIVVPALLVAEVVLFRKWCSRICPLGALMSLVGKANRTFRPVVNEDACLESSRHVSCEACAAACPEGINPRHPEAGASWSECTKCRACVDACPAKAITLPLLPSSGKRLTGEQPAGTPCSAASQDIGDLAVGNSDERQAEAS